MLQSQITINYEALHLMELSKMSIIESFVTEHSINREEFSWSELFLLGDHLKVAGRDCSSVSTENIFVGLLGIPFIIITYTTETAFLMDIFHCLEICFILDSCCFWLRDKKSVVSITSRMSLRLEQSIKIPKRTFNISVSLHFLEAHLKQDLYKLLFGLHE
jgi:hypothetical protein